MLQHLVWCYVKIATVCQNLALSSPRRGVNRILYNEGKVLQVLVY